MIGGLPSRVPAALEIVFFTYLLFVFHVRACSGAHLVNFLTGLLPGPSVG